MFGTLKKNQFDYYLGYNFLKMKITLAFICQLKKIRERLNSQLVLFSSIYSVITHITQLFGYSLVLFCQIGYQVTNKIIKTFQFQWFKIRVA